MMDYIVISQSEPTIELNEAKRHVKAIMSVGTEDELTETMIAAAEEYAENYTGRSLSKKTIEAYPKTFADLWTLPRTPISRVISIDYIAPDGTTKRIDSEKYRIVNLSESIEIDDAPEVKSGASRPITVQYEAGYASIPFAIRQAMLLMIGHWTINRETVITGQTASVEVEMTTRALLNQYKVWWF